MGHRHTFNLSDLFSTKSDVDTSVTGSLYTIYYPTLYHPVSIFGGKMVKSAESYYHRAIIGFIGPRVRVFAEMNAQVSYERTVSINKIRYISTVTYGSSATWFAFMILSSHIPNSHSMRSPLRSLVSLSLTIIMLPELRSRYSYRLYTHAERLVEKSFELHIANF